MDILHEAKALIGKVLRPIHAGDSKLISHQEKVASAGPGDAKAAAAAGSAGPANLTLTSAAFTEGSVIPAKYSQEGANVSPPIKWSGVPKEAKELVLICEDPDAPMLSPYLHWAIWGLSPLRRNLVENIAQSPEPSNLVGSKQGQNGAKAFGYTGPLPPAGHGVHHYHFQLFALDKPVKLSPDAGRDDFIKAMSGHVLAMGEIVGTFERK